MSKSGNRNSNLRAKIRVFIALTIIGAVALAGAAAALISRKKKNTK